MTGKAQAKLVTVEGLIAADAAATAATYAERIEREQIRLRFRGGVSRESKDVRSEYVRACAG